MSTSNYKTTNTIGTGIIYDYFDLSGFISIKSSYNETSTDGTKLKNVGSLSNLLKHVNPIGYKINYSDIYNLYVPKCYVFFGPLTTSFSVPSLTTRIVFFLQAPGGGGANGSTSPDNPGGYGGSGALGFGHIDRNANPATTITLNITAAPVQVTPSIASTFVFTGGTSVTVTCYSGQPGQGTNSNGAGGAVPTPLTAVGLQAYDYEGGVNGFNNSGASIVSPYAIYPTIATSYSVNGPTVYFPLVTGPYGYGGAGGNSNGSAGSPGFNGIAAIWFLL